MAGTTLKQQLLRCIPNSKSTLRAAKTIYLQAMHAPLRALRVRCFLQ